MPASRSVLCLWLASTASFGCAAFSIGYDHGTQAVIDIEQLDLGGGQSFALSFPPLIALATALLFLAVAIAGLLVSCLRNKQPFLSLLHSPALLLAVPVMAAVPWVVNAWS
jgi:hypothetical protein